MGPSFDLLGMVTVTSLFDLRISGDLTQASVRVRSLQRAVSPRQRRRLANGADISSLVHRIELGDVSLRIILDLSGLTDGTDKATLLAPPIDVPISLRQVGRNRPIVVRAVGDTECRDSELIALVADARRWRDDLLEGKVVSVAAITEREEGSPRNRKPCPAARLARSGHLSGRTQRETSARVARPSTRLE